ncbi:TonB-dependent receptor domain-containing protein [Pseudoduganella violaceinigra]|uniref:TonB-dependent receptor domain-containing protein n=1 Tax=Pseudoduganella violaceinigra TaxID=246602 RepID=UPI000401879D|nr:TonB-dependent receptor [Pseudoduganella violaceinigra]
MTSPAIRQAAFASLALAFAAPAVQAQVQAPVLHSVLVTATRSPQAARDIVSDTLSISAEEIGRSGAGSITELLQRQRGIEVTRNGGPGTSSSVFLRGSNGNQVIVLVDGVRIASASSGAAAWNAIPLGAVDHIEVVYGPLSTLYGADAIGGVVQVFTKKGQGGMALDASLLAGSYGTRAGTAGIAGSAAAFSYALHAGKERSDGFSATLPGSTSYNADKDGYDRKHANGQLAWQFAPGQEVGAMFLHSGQESDYDSGAKVRAWSTQKLDTVGIYSRNRLNDIWQMTTHAAQSRDKSGSFAATASQIDTKQSLYSWQNDFALGQDSLQLLAEHRQEEVASNTAALVHERSTTSWAASYNMKRGAHLLAAAVRNDDSSQYGSKSTGSLGYGYRITPGLRLNAGYGTSFRAPTFNELYYPGYGLPDNRPEQGRNGEIGIQFDQGGTALGAVVYRNKLTDLLVNTKPCPAPGFPSGCAYNVSKATLEGISLSARQHLGSAFTISASADLQHPQDDGTGKLLVRRANRHGNVALDYTAGSLSAGAEWQVSGYRFDDAANRSRLGGYGLFNLYAAWECAPSWTATLRWNNVGNKHYELARNYGTAGSTAYAGLRYSYK